MSASVVVYNEAVWSITIMAFNTLANKLDEKNTDTALVACGSSRRLFAHYQWNGHPADRWWHVLKQNGVVVYTSPVYVRF